MKTQYYPAQVYAKEALCDNCGQPLKYIRSDFSRPRFSWLHHCEKCGAQYWLDNRYPLIDYGINFNAPLEYKTDPIEYEPVTPENKQPEKGKKVYCSIDDDCDTLPPMGGFHD